MPVTDRVPGGLAQIATRIGELIAPTVILGLMVVIAIFAIYRVNRYWPGRPARTSRRRKCPRVRPVDGYTPDRHDDVDN